MPNQETEIIDWNLVRHRLADSSPLAWLSMVGLALLIVPDRYRYSVLLRAAKPITFMNDLKQRLEYKKTSPALTGDVVGGST